MAVVDALREPLALSAIEEAARAYDALGEEYLQYADGDTQDLFAFDGPYGFADREVWARIDAALVDLRAQGRRTIRILDLGCGPGTWLMRTMVRAHTLGFQAVIGRGIDVSRELIALAWTASERVANLSMELHFEVADIISALAAGNKQSAVALAREAGFLPPEGQPLKRHMEREELEEKLRELGIEIPW